jgi:hypothetical protein
MLNKPNTIGFLPFLFAVAIFIAINGIITIDNVIMYTKTGAELCDSI